MPSSEYPPFDPDATLDEFADVGKHRRFDKKIDDAEDQEIQIIYKRGIFHMISAHRVSVLL